MNQRIERPGLLTRLSESIKAFQMRWGAQGSSWEAVRLYSTIQDLQRAAFSTKEGTIDYSAEAGDPTTLSLPMAAVRWLGNVLPEAPIQVKEATEKGDAQEVKNHPLVELLRRPNPFYSGSTLWKAFSLSWILSGNVYFLKQRNLNGRVLELWYVPHWQMTPAWPSSGAEFISHYVYRPEGSSEGFRVERGDVIHFRDGIDPYNQRLGMSPLNALWRELYGDVAASRYSARVSRNFGVPPFALMPKPDVNGVEVDVEKIKDSLMRSITGDNTGKPLVFAQPFDVHEFSAKPAEMDLKTQRRIPEERVAAVIGIPGMVLGFGSALERSTYSNMEEAEEHAYESYLIPLHRYTEEELNLQLLPDLDDRPNRFVRHDLSQVRALQDDEDKKFQRLSMAYRNGWIMRSEARASAGFQTKPEDEVYFVQPKTETAPAEQITPEGRLRLVKSLKAYLESKNGHEKDETKQAPPDEEIDEVVVWWKENAPPEAKDLIEAEEVN